MASVTKSKSGKYYLAERLWVEARECGLSPFYVGKWRGYYRIPKEPNKDVLRELFEGRPLGRVQANRIAVYDHTFSWHKSVTIATYGMTPPTNWAGWTKAYAEVVRKVLKPRLAAQVAKTGAQGKDKEPSRGVAVVFPGWRGAFGQLQAHAHGAVVNLTATKDGRAFSIGNAHESYRDQALMRALSNKLMDDVLRAKGFRTVRKGNQVGVAGVPEGMVQALSPTRAAMDQARKGKGRGGPKAQDFAASKANRLGKKLTGKVTPEEAYTQCQEVAKRYSLTPEKLRSAPAAADPGAAQYTAYEVALEARDRCTRRYGSFTEQQFMRWMYTFGIGRDTTAEALRSTGKLFLKSRAYAGIEKSETADGQVRYHVPPTPEATIPGGKDKAKEKATGFQPDPKETARAAERPYVREAWAELKAAVKGLGGAVLVATVRTAADAANRLAEFINPAPKTLRLDAADLDRFLTRHGRTNYFVAHRKALLKGLLASGNPHERAAVAERAFARLRAFRPVPRNTVIVVRRGPLATADQLRKLAAVARRDGCSVVLCERPEPDKAFDRPKPARPQRLRQSLRRHGFKAGRDRIH